MNSQNRKEIKIQEYRKKSIALLTTIFLGIGLIGIVLYIILDEERIISNEISKRLQKGKFLFPVLGKITSKWGKRIHPVTGEEKHHNGIDIGANKGTLIKSPDDGVVIRVWYDELNGNAMRIKNKEGFIFGMAHLNKVYVKEGQKVKKGETIGEVGDTGVATGTHLHLSVFSPLTGRDIDPLALQWENLPITS